MKKTLSSALTVAVGVGAAALVAGCERESRARPGSDNNPNVTVPTPRPDVNKGSPVNQQAIQGIVAARCQREARCNNFGSGKKYDSQAACVSKLSEEMRDDLNSADCRGGVVQKELAECLEEIRNEDCNNPLDTLGRLAACRTSDLCKAMPNGTP